MEIRRVDWSGLRGRPLAIGSELLTNSMNPLVFALIVLPKTSSPVSMEVIGAAAQNTMIEILALTVAHSFKVRLGVMI